MHRKLAPVGEPVPGGCAPQRRAQPPARARLCIQPSQQLAHAGIHRRIAGPALGPGIEAPASPAPPDRAPVSAPRTSNGRWRGSDRAHGCRSRASTAAAGRPRPSPRGRRCSASRRDASEVQVEQSADLVAGRRIEAIGVRRRRPRRERRSTSAAGAVATRRLGTLLREAEISECGQRAGGDAGRRGRQAAGRGKHAPGVAPPSCAQTA